MKPKRVRYVTRIIHLRPTRNVWVLTTDDDGRYGVDGPYEAVALAIRTEELEYVDLDLVDVQSLDEVEQDAVKYNAMHALVLSPWAQRGDGESYWEGMNDLFFAIEAAQEAAERKNKDRD